MKKGFSLIGLLLVLVVLMTLLAWMLPQYLRTAQQQHQTQKGALEQARELQRTLNAQSRQQQFQLDNLERALQSMPSQTGAARKTNVPRQTGATRKAVKK